MSPRTFQVGLNVTVDKTWVNVTSRHHWSDSPERFFGIFDEGGILPFHVALD
jgi:hypothetical protein